MNRLNTKVHRIEVFYYTKDYREDVILQNLRKLGFDIGSVRLTDNYLINANITAEQSEKIANLLIQPVTQKYIINSPFIPENFEYAVEIGFLPGVTDNVAGTVRELIEDLYRIELDGLLPSKILKGSNCFIFFSVLPAALNSPITSSLVLLLINASVWAKKLASSF